MSRPTKSNAVPRGASHGTAAVELRLAAIDIPPRLTFLTELKSRSAFEGSAVLDQIIADYRHALTRARGIDVAASAKK